MAELQTLEEELKALKRREKFVSSTPGFRVGTYKGKYRGVLLDKILPIWLPTYQEAVEASIKIVNA